MNIKRTNRIASEIHKIVSGILIDGIKDPRVTSMTTISDVKVTNDLSYATLYVSVLGDEETRNEAMQGLENAKGYIRKVVGSNLDIRHIPELRFELDTTVDRGIRIEELLHQVKNEKHHEDESL